MITHTYPQNGSKTGNSNSKMIITGIFHGIVSEMLSSLKRLRHRQDNKRNKQNVEQWLHTGGRH